MSAFARRALLWGLSACLLLSMPAAGAAQDTPAQRRKAVLEGTHVFRRILYDHRLEPLNDFDSLADDPSRTLLVVLGNLDAIANVPGGLKDFVDRGGAVLLASDRSLRSDEARRALRSVAGVSISNDTLVCLNLEFCYFSREFCPYVYPARDDRLGLLGPPPGRDRYGVATNVPSFLRLRGGGPATVQVLAFLPSFCRLDIRRNQPLQEDWWPPFMVGGDVGKGRVLVLADHSVFINEMMLPDDNNNVEFTIACVRWLRGAEDATPRSRVLLVEDGKIQTNLAIPLKSAVVGPEEALRALYANRNELLVKAEETVANLERQDFFNEQFLRLLYRAGLTPDRIALTVLVLATLALVMYGVYRLGIRTRFRHPTEAPLLTRAVGASLPAAPLVDQRVHTLVRLGNLNEPAARLAGRWFERQGLPVTVAGPAEPPVEVVGGWWRRRQLLGQLRRLWRLAQGRSTERVEPAGLWRLQRELDRLQVSRERGEWRPLGRGSAA
jgi:hypothetical protein